MKKTPQMKVVPIATKSEAAALALIAIDRNILAQQTWDVDYFALPPHRKVFTALQGVHQRTGACCPFSAIAELEATGEIEAAGGENEADDYRKQLVRNKGYRDVIKVIEEEEPNIRVGKSDLKKLSETIMRCSEDRGVKIKPVKDIILEIIDEMEGKAKEQCFTTGMIRLDRTLRGGLHHGELLTVASETGGGKSIFLVQAAVANLLNGKSVIFFSLEMNAKDILTRMACNLAGYPIRERAEYLNANKVELDAITNALTKLHGMPLQIIDAISDINDIESNINRYVGENRADVVIVDYLQIVSIEGVDNRENAISEITRRLKVSASVNKLVLLTASQLNDEGRLRESRAIGMHSNQIIYVEHLKTKSQVTVKKNRRGPKDYRIDIIMHGETSRIEEVF
jgi:replicative DNA helicase